MPEIVAASPDLSCSLLLSGSGIEESQSLGPDPFPHRARDAHGRFVKGSSGNPPGRLRGIPNPRRRVPDLVARPLSAQALSDLLAAVDPAERLGIDLSSLHTAEDLRQVLSTVMAALARGKIAPAEAARIAGRTRARLAPSGAERRLGYEVL
jgi:hypothetical protein